MKDNKGMDSSQYKGAKLMKNHGNTTSIKADAQKYDMGRMQRKGMEHKGNSMKAYDYKY